MRNKILSLLVLLLTAATGAWAIDGVKLTTVEIVPPAAWENDYTDLLLSDMPGLKADGITEEQAKAWADLPQTGEIELIYGYDDKGDWVQFKKISFSNGEFLFSNSVSMGRNNISFEVNQGIKYYYATGIEQDITVEWNASTKTGTFSMPGSDVVLTPQYAPAAKWDVVETVEQLPAALEGIIAGQDAAIVTPGQSAQGTPMYAVTTSAEAAPALTAFSATVPTAKDYDDATTVYVWYYIAGANTPDGEDPTADNTFNDSEISATPLKVDILTNKFDLTLQPAPVKNMTVTVAGQAKTPTDEGKLQAVKMQSEVKLKAATGYKFRKVEVKKKAKTITVTWENPIKGFIGSIHDGESRSKDGVTVKALKGLVDGDMGNAFMGVDGGNSFQFSTSLGNFTKIEVTCSFRYVDNGNGWSSNVWTGSASTVNFGTYFTPTKIVFTIEPTN